MSFVYVILLGLLSTIIDASCRYGRNVVLNLDTDLGAIPNEKTHSVMNQNTLVFSRALNECASNNTILVSGTKTFYLYHGVYANGTHDAVIQIDGTLRFERNFHEGRHENFEPNGKRPTPCFLLENANNVTFTSSNSRENHRRGLIHGGGSQWWGIPLLGYLNLQEHRPILLHVNRTQNMLIENLVFQDSPYWTLKFECANFLEIRDISIVSRRTNRDYHSLADLSAFNSDGIDVAGHNVHVHDVDIWNQDDCIAVKDNHCDGEVSSNMTFERIHASGLGMTIGSIGGSTVQNITFRDCFLHKTFKGIYLKFRKPSKYSSRSGLIRDVLFENITMEQPQQWGVWIGPAQQADTRNPCAPHPCSLCWPTLPLAECNTVEKSRYVNITLRNVTINNPLGSPGVIMGDDDYGIDGIVFDNVLVKHGPPIPFPSGSWLAAFPGLSEPVDDPNLRRGYELGFFVIGIVAATTLFCVGRRIYRGQCCKTNNTRHQQLPQEENDETDGAASSRDKKSLLSMLQSPQGGTNDKRLQCRIAMALILSALMAYTCWRARSVSKRVGDRNNYFVCQGVSNGDARGSTWPIPSCFSDHTLDTSMAYQQDPSTIRTVLMVTFVFFLLASCVLFAWLLWSLYAYRNWRQEHSMSEPIEQESCIPGSSYPEDGCLVEATSQGEFEPVNPHDE